MQITDSYRKRLVRLVKDIEVLNRPKILVSNSPDQFETIRQTMEIKLDNKLAYLMGFIMALDEEGELRNHGKNN